MELSARDKRILADIECESALEDPKWTRRFERLGRHGTRSRARRRVWRRRGPGALLGPPLGAVLAAAWLTAVVLGAVLLRPILWAALAIGLVGCLAWSARRKRIHGYWLRRRPRISRIPRQGGGPPRGHGAD